MYTHELTRMVSGETYLHNRGNPGGLCGNVATQQCEGQTRRHARAVNLLQRRKHLAQKPWDPQHAHTHTHAATLIQCLFHAFSAYVTLSTFLIKHKQSLTRHGNSSTRTRTCPVHTHQMHTLMTQTITGVSCQPHNLLKLKMHRPTVHP